MIWIATVVFVIAMAKSATGNPAVEVIQDLLVVIAFLLLKVIALLAPRERAKR